MKILFACGGTAGHINPALAVAGVLKSERPQVKILFAGNPHGMEAKLVPKAGYPFAPIEIQGFQRKPTPRNFVYNIRSAGLLMSASGKARQILSDFRPNVVVGTGGYVSGPILRTAAKMGIKTVTHEQNAFPGVTTKLLTKYVDKVLLAVEEARVHLPAGIPYTVTGNPIREEILFADREKARKALGVDERICFLSFGGSLGAKRINEAMAEVFAHFEQSHRLHHIHATGQYGTELFPSLLEKKGVRYRDNPHMDIREYIDNMPDCLAAADLVLCRSGAISLSELEAAGKASILIPSPNVAENHQYHNAMVLGARNAAVVIEEKDLNGEALCRQISQLIEDPEELANIGRNAATLAIVDAAQRICAEVLGLVEQK